MNNFIENMVKTAKDNFPTKQDPSKVATAGSAPYIGQTNDIESGGAPNLQLKNSTAASSF